MFGSIFREQTHKNNLFAVFDQARVVDSQIFRLRQSLHPEHVSTFHLSGDVMECIVLRLVTTTPGATPVDWDALVHNAQTAIVTEAQSQSDAISLRDLRQTAETDRRKLL